MIDNINWYPGHMKKTRELIKENLKMVDAVAEVIDARIPLSSRNPVIDRLVGEKPRIILLNKSDLADDRANQLWEEYFKSSGAMVIKTNALSPGTVKRFMRLLENLRDEKNKDKQMKRPYRIMIVGVPNVGKSSLINRLTGKKSTSVGDKPGVTKGKQWLNIDGNIQLLDTPGILWPKFEDPKAGLYLAFCGSIKDEIMDTPSLGLELIKLLKEEYIGLLTERYKLDDPGKTPLECMENIAGKRGFILAGKKIDYERTGRTVLDEFRSGTIGKITLERPENE